MTVESTSGGDPKDLDGDGVWRFHDDDGNSSDPDLAGGRGLRPARDGSTTDIVLDNDLTRNSDAVGGQSGARAGDL